MSSLQQLEKDARERRAQFEATFSDVKCRLTLPGLAKEALLHVDPHLSRLPPAFLAAGALAGASWLLKRVRKYKNGHANPKTLKKEITHESN